MKIIRSIRQMSKISDGIRRKSKTLGFVPTMGALHEGHLSLIRRAGKENNFVAVSIFVNPAQFGPEEDFKRYPRDLNNDARLCRRGGVDFIFYPQAKNMYPPGYKTYIEVGQLSRVLCGKFRPGHFKGVTTIVAKLFNIVAPTTAYFGQKDAQQAIIIKKMVEDLNIPVEIKIMPTIRDKDGLALSSRNIYLSPRERTQARVLFHVLSLAKNLIRKGEKRSSEVIRKMEELINKQKDTRLQYVAIVDIEGLKPIQKIRGKVLIALAVYIGKTRLIDNIIVN